MQNVTTKSVTKSAERIVTREVRGEEKDLIKVPISSTRADRDGDEFSASALGDMAAQIRREQPKVFQNHGFTGFMEPMYSDRETIGTHMDAEVVDIKDSDGDKVLNAFILPDTTHSEGQRMLDQVEEGHAEKFSVGFRVHEAEPKNPESENDERRIFQAVDHMETSKVGIPANPDASAQVAAKAAGLAEQFDAEDFDMDAAEFASVLAGELVRKSGRVTREDVEDATPTQYDGQQEVVMRAEPIIVDSELREAMDLSPMETNETKDECDTDTDCPEGEVCLEGECVPEDEVEDSARIDRLESRFESLEETITDALGDGTEPDDGQGTEPPETFAVEVDGETKEYTKDDIRDLQAAAEDADAETAQTVESADAHDGVDVEPDESEAAEPDETDGESDSNQSIQEMIHQ